MPKENPYLENKKPIELVQELKDEYKAPSYEEFAKDYEIDENIIDSYNFEVASHGNIEVGKKSGPMPFSDEALTIAHSDAIMRRIRNDFPNVARLIDDMPSATLGFLKANGALSGYRVITHDFGFPFTDTTSKNGPDAWQRYREEIEKYVDKICRRSLDGKLFEELWGARRVLVDYIHTKYYDLLPFWPSIGETKTRSFEANIGSSYDYGSSSKVVWNCLGWITVKDERPERYTYKAQFSGNPELKVLILNGYKMREIENDARDNFEGARRKISGGESRYRMIDWDTKYL